MQPRGILEERFAALLPHETDGVDVENQRRCATCVSSFRIGHVRLAESELDAVQPSRILVEKESKVGRRLMRRRDREEHEFRPKKATRFRVAGWITMQRDPMDVRGGDPRTSPARIASNLRRNMSQRW